MIHTISIHDKNYPEILKEIADPPETLYAQGNLGLLEEPGLAIVGMRRCSKLGENLAFEWARTLSSQGLIIVSGLAFGIDAAAHRGALKGTGKTIAVVPSCLPEITPRSHRKLANEILASGGLLLSEMDVPRPPLKHEFLVRNRLVSGLSRGVLIVEAAHRSGSLNTANHALDQNRDIMAIPGRINDPCSQGSNRLIQEGAAMVTRPQDVITVLGLEWRDQAQIKLPIEIQKIFNAICKAPESASKFPRALLTQMELDGLIKRDAYGRYSSGIG